jgi:hypothetical protein
VSAPPVEAQTSPSHTTASMPWERRKMVGAGGKATFQL